MVAYESVIGLEVHAQLRTRTKIFCGCATGFGAPPNSQTCPVCLGHPGALPVPNRRAIELALRAAVALDCDVQPESAFARKHYFYPDLPKGYQISQYERPLARGGSVTIECGGAARRIGLARLHLEEDAGKLVHDGLPDSDTRTHVDLNRAGVPLIEIVSRPEIGDPAEAYRFLERLRSVLRYIEVCDGSMERGSLRCDANVSIRPAGSKDLGPRTELKNLNSFRNVQRALEYEIRRQVERVQGGGRVEQETVQWDPALGLTRPMRGKEEAEDYRYLPDPDLPPLALDAVVIERVRGGLPELPHARKARLAREYGLGETEAHLLTLERSVAELFEAAARASGNPRAASNFVLNDLPREQNALGLAEGEIPLSAESLAELIRLVDGGTISVTMARQELFGALCRDQASPAELVRQHGLEQVSDERALRELVRDVLERMPEQVRSYRAGKAGLLGYFVGQVMRASAGKANPALVRSLVEEALR